MPFPFLLRGLAARLVRECAARGKLVGLAESCTGGYLSKLITDVPGSSRILWGGLVVYSNEAKIRYAGVSPDTLKTHGAVSGETVSELLSGLLAAGPLDLALAVSGIAGPGGGSDDKPVGTVWIGLAVRGSDPCLIRYRFSGSRGAVRRQACRKGMESLLKALESQDAGKP